MRSRARRRTRREHSTHSKQFAWCAHPKARAERGARKYLWTTLRLTPASARQHAVTASWRRDPPATGAPRRRARLWSRPSTARRGPLHGLRERPPGCEENEENPGEPEAKTVEQVALLTDDSWLLERASQISSCWASSPMPRRWFLMRTASAGARTSTKSAHDPTSIYNGALSSS
jgi:hypothetical protein